MKVKDFFVHFCLISQLYVMYRRGYNVPQYTNAVLGLLNQQAWGLQRYAAV